MKKIITVSREFGSGGRTVGRLVAEKLGYKFYDDEIIERVMAKSGLSREIVEKYDEYATHKNSFLYSIAVNTGNGAYNTLSFADQVHISQMQVIKEMAEEGDCVIIGRGADYILRDRADALHTFIRADLDFRAKHIIETYGETDQRIETRIKDKDAKRKVYYRSFTMREWGLMENYDIMLNSGEIGIEACADIICGIVKASKD